MSTTSTVSQKRIRWRLLAVTTIAFAIGLGVIGVSVALRQVQAVTVRLMSQAHLRARQVAATAEARYARQREHLLRVLRAEGCPNPGARKASSAALPAWVDGLFAWDGSEIDVLAAPSATVEAITARVKKTLVGASVTASPEKASPERKGTIEASSSRLTLITVDCSEPGAKPITLVARVQQNRLLTELIDPLLEQDDGLELVSSKDSGGLWSHALSGPLRGWSLQPSAAFVQEQQALVFGQTLTYIALTALALVALLIAMWLLARAARRDMALAELKSHFVADVSHELKTPLSVIRLYAETLQSGRPLSEEKRQSYYTIIERESTRLTNLINNILDFARIEAGRRAYRMEPTDIASVVRDTYRAYRAELDHQGFEHHLTVADSLPSVKADGDAIGQALLNLMSNAVKYSADEKFMAISVTMDTRRDRQGVVISVEDHGIGIQPTDRAHVFEGFFRAGDGRVQRQGGTGLGLSLVKHIVDAHGGMLLVESRLVKGTAFRIFLPVSGERPHRDAVSNPDDPETHHPPEGRR